LRENGRKCKAQDLADHFFLLDHFLFSSEQIQSNITRSRTHKLHAQAPLKQSSDQVQIRDYLTTFTTLSNPETLSG
jgi:hypothetical protein